MWLAAVDLDAIGKLLVAAATAFVTVFGTRKAVRLRRESRNGTRDALQRLRQENQRLSVRNETLLQRLQEAQDEAMGMYSIHEENRRLRDENARLRKRRRGGRSSSSHSR